MIETHEEEAVCKWKEERRELRPAPASTMGRETFSSAVMVAIRLNVC